ncbi:MAG: MerC domain-containing protein [Xanthomonadales bacterium]|nr:MerC domain-containing protein [Xanthomonadales bacterium]
MKRNPGLLDRIAILLSGVCLLHCLMAPALVTLLPILGAATLSHNHFHLWLLWLILPTSTLALFMGCRQHRDLVIVGLGVLGLGLIVGVAAIGEQMEPVRERIFTSIGGVVLAISHVLNYRSCRRLSCPE